MLDVFRLSSNLGRSNAQEGKTPEIVETTIPPLSVESFRLINDFSDIKKSLGEKIYALNIGFNATHFLDSFEKLSIDRILSQSKIPNSAKEIFLSDLRTLVMRFSEYISLDKLKTSLIQNRYETLGAITGSKDSLSGSLEAILRGTFEKYVIGVSVGLRASFIDEKKVGAGSYNREVWDSFSDTIGTLDVKYGIKISEFLQGHTDREYIGNNYLARDISIEIIKKYGGNIPPEVFRDILNKIIASPDAFEIALEKFNSGVNTTSPSYRLDICFSPSTYSYIEKNGTVGLNIFTVLRDYRMAGRVFNKQQSEIGDARDSAMARSVSSKVAKSFGGTELKNEFEYLESAELKKDMTFEELVRIAHQLTRIFIPGVDGANDIVTALNAIDNSTGIILPQYERFTYAFFGMLDISAIGGVIARMRKAKKIQSLVKIFQKSASGIPSLIEKHLAQGGKISKETYEVLMRLAKILRIENIGGIGKYKVGNKVEFKARSGNHYIEGEIVSYNPEKKVYQVKISGTEKIEDVNLYRITDKVGGIGTLPFGHGSSSAGLLSMIREGGLMPTGLLLKKGNVPFGGTIDPGILHPRGVNHQGVSLTYKGGEVKELDYAKQAKGWNLVESKDLVASLKSGATTLNDLLGKLDSATPDSKTWGEFVRNERYRGYMNLFGDIPKNDPHQFEKWKKSAVGWTKNEIEQKMFQLRIEEIRQREYPKLSKIEQALIDDPFPIIYKIGDIPVNYINNPGSQKEAVFRGILGISNIRGMLVPQEKIDFVKRLLREANIHHIQVQEI